MSKYNIRVLVDSDIMFVCTFEFNGDNFLDEINIYFNNLGMCVVKTVEGKPYIVDNNGEIDVSVNWSHTGNVLLLGFGKGFSIGVDVEEVHPVTERKDYYDWVFHSNEIELKRDIGFYRMWVRKESYLKMLGLGLVDGMHEIDSSIGNFVSGNYVCRDREFEWSVSFG